MADNDQPSSLSPFERFEKVMKALVQVPKKAIQEKTAEIRRKRPKQAPSNKSA